MTTLAGHISPETAYLQPDYPYSFHLRCQRRVWLEYKPKHGYRMVTQTTNPRRSGTVWNTPKAGIYHPIAVLYTSDDGHVHLSTLRLWEETAVIDNFAAMHAEGLGEREQKILRLMRAQRLKYEEIREERARLAKETAS